MSKMRALSGAGGTAREPKHAAMFAALTVPHPVTILCHGSDVEQLSRADAEIFLDWAGVSGDCPGAVPLEFLERQGPLLGSCSFLAPSGIYRIVSVPIRQVGKAVGRAGLCRESSLAPFRDDEIALLRQCGEVMAGLLSTLGDLVPDHAYEAAATRAVGAGDGDLFVVDVERSEVVWSSASESALSPVFEAELAAAAKHSLRVQTGDARSIIAPTITGAVLLRAAYIVDPIGRGAVYAACRVQIVGAKSAALSLLSPREGRIAELLVQGYTALNVALITGITEHTVRTHIRRIYRKFGIRSRSALVHSLAKADAAPPRQHPRGVRRMDSGFTPIVTDRGSSKKASG